MAEKRPNETSGGYDAFALAQDLEQIATDLKFVPMGIKKRIVHAVYDRGPEFLIVGYDAFRAMHD